MNMVTKTGTQAGNTNSVDKEIAEILELKRQIEFHEESDLTLKGQIIAAMLKDKRTEMTLPGGIKIRLFEAQVGGEYHNPSFVMNRMHRQVDGEMVNLIPFDTMVNLISFSSDAVNKLVKTNRISEDDSTKVFVAGYSVRDEYLRFY